MIQDSIFLGLDVHKDTIAVAVADGDGGDVRSLGLIPNTLHAVHVLLHRLSPATQLTACYEAGPCGYALYRHLTRLGVHCLVVAPSLVPTKPGDRVKTDRRDATKLARLLRSRELTPVWVPDEAHEALRDLTRAREDARYDLLRARHRLSKLLLRLDVLPPAGVAAWTHRHETWLETVKLSYPAQQLVFAESRLAIAQVRLHRRFWRLTHRGKPTHKAVVARELLGFIWAIGQRVERSTQTAA